MPYLSERTSDVYRDERFPRCKGSEADFEQIWLSRDSHLDKVPGFVEFHLTREEK